VNIARLPELLRQHNIFRGRAGATRMLYERESAKLVSGTLASTTTLQSRVGTRCGRAGGAGNPLIPRGRRHTRCADLGALIPRQHGLKSIITCPRCGHAAIERMPTNVCQIFYDCRGCGARLKPKTGDCCVFCSYGSVPCPPVQAKQADVQR
jgi:hypothetical protein